MSRLIDIDDISLRKTIACGGLSAKALWRRIQQQPTIDAVEVVRGEWKEREVLEDTVINEWQSARCSECGKYHTTPYMYYFDNFDFCPNCGARMKGADDE